MSTYDEQQSGAQSGTPPYRGGASDSPYASYTSAPQAPAGYDFTRTASAPAVDSTMPDGASGGLGADGRSPYATGPLPPSASAGDGGGRRGPGWGGVIGTSLVVALLACGGTAAGLQYFGRGLPTASPASAPTSVATGATTQTVSSTGTAPDWEAVTAAVSNAVVSITVEQGQSTSARGSSTTPPGTS